MMRLCPNCGTERGVQELFCEGLVSEHSCGWDLTDVPLRPVGWRPAPVTTPTPTPVLAPSQLRCMNGHSYEPGDLLCPTCGVDLETVDDAPAEAGSPPPAEPISAAPTVVGTWRLERRLQSASQVRERYFATRVSDERQAVLTLYVEGSEPDLEVYEVLKAIPRAHVPEIIETGRWQNRVFEVMESAQVGTLADVGALPNDAATLASILREVGSALNAFAERGLRHRDLRPAAVLVRSLDPLDLVVGSFGSARLSEFDLDIVSPLETTRYTAPEAVAGGVSAASDWWSLGIVLLEHLTRGACFEGIRDTAFLIHVLANGAPIPSGLDPTIELLLRGLLSLDRKKRWGWPEVQRWLDGELPDAPSASRGSEQPSARRAIRLADRSFVSPAAIALAAAESANWDEARNLLLRGDLATWVDEAKLDDALAREIRQVMQVEGVTDDIRLALALKALNPAMPLVCRGEIITPGWLLDHPEEGYALISGPVPELLKAKQSELWLDKLSVRAELVRERAGHLDIALNEHEVRVHLLSTSRVRLAAIWEERRRLLPDTDHPGLISILERRQSADEDYILLLSADVGQFRTAEAIVAEASEIASRAGVSSFNPADASAWLERPRRQLHAEIERRLEGFARSGNEQIDGWADQFRLERRLTIGRALTLLALPEAAWSQPPKQAYVASLIDFFSKRVTGSVMRGPLVRMVIGKTTARLDLTELGSERRPSSALLDLLLLRSERTFDLDSTALASTPLIEDRLRRLYSHANLYRRDTGIDGLYLGFPFLLMRDSRPSTKPRIAPVLLWPIKIVPEVGARGRVSLGFDRDREEVRLNPAFETLMGIDAARRWNDAAKDFLAHRNGSADDVMDAFRSLVSKVGDPGLVSIPSKDSRVGIGEDQLVCAGALFHLAYMGQAIMEDLRQLKSIPPTGTSLETALKAGNPVERPSVERAREADRYFTAPSDPSQELAVLEARCEAGLLIEGPPGTGKSQTIVNMVADAIGRQKTLLVVCQKHAALEVVHKRLEAEGLAGRVIIVNDINKDRQPVIRSIREQLEAVLGRPPDPGGRRQARVQLAARIEALEGDLDRYHDALHAHDARSGLSYRQVLGDLVGLESGLTTAIDVPALRRKLDKLDVGQLATLQETCGPIARLWLAADFEDSPLHVLRSFSGDPSTVLGFASELEQFVRQEHERLQVIDYTPLALEMPDPAPYRQWSKRHATTWQELDESARERLARWFPRADRDASISQATAHIQELGDIESALVTETARTVLAPEFQLASGLSVSDSRFWIDLLVRLTGRPRFWDQLLLRRWRRARTVAAFLRQHTLESPEALLNALQSNETLRPLRSRLLSVREALQEMPLELNNLRASELLVVVRKLKGELSDALAIAVSLLEHPQQHLVFGAVRAKSLEAVSTLLQSQEEGYARHQAREASLAVLAGLEAWIEAEWVEDRRHAIVTKASNVSPLQKLSAALPTTAAFQRFRARADQLDSATLDILRTLRSVRARLLEIPEEALDGEVRRIVGREARLGWKSRFELERPELLFEADDLKAKAVALAGADHEMRKLTRQLLVEGIDPARLKPLREWEDITRLTGQRSRRLREFMDRGADLGLMALRPVWLMNPDIASRVLPFKRALFDSVIFDEASQMPIEYALPTLYRSRAMIVSGDEKQMPPTNFFASKVENDEADLFEGDEAEDGVSESEREEIIETWNRREIKDCPDLLQLAKTVLPTTVLQIHYRSAYRELIQFSNASFYAGRLSVPVRHPDAEISRVKPIEVIRVDGIYQEQTNEKEAHVVAEEVAKQWTVPAAERKTVGVVTFNRKQADLIEEVLEARAEGDAPFREALAQERDRIVGGEDMGFFVKNVENVQGDERDVMIFSSTFGRNGQGAFRRTFGVLGQAGGERRLNVAVTRAREKVILVTSMPVADISDLLATRRNATSPRDYLQAYFEYARALSAGELSHARSLLNRLGPGQRPDMAQHEPAEDGIQTAVRAFIEGLGWSPHVVRDAGAFALDFAVVDPRTGLYGIGIECDAPRHPLLERGRAREMWRPMVLQRSVPRIHRVSSHGWLSSPDREKALLRAAIRDALGEEVAT